jgi:hypothetical protein
MEFRRRNDARTDYRGHLVQRHGVVVQLNVILQDLPRCKVPMAAEGASISRSVILEFVLKPRVTSAEEEITTTFATSGAYVCL